MPLFKIRAAKAVPTSGLQYVTRKDKAIYKVALNLCDGTPEEYTRQFKETAEYFNKDTGYDTRKYYSCVLSPKQSDNISPEAMLQYAIEMAEACFPDHECVIGVHSDKEVIHAHIIVNAVNFKTGKKLDIRHDDYGALKDKANEIGLEYGLTPTDFRKPAGTKRNNQEMQIINRLGTSYKEDLREAIVTGMDNARSIEEYKQIVESFKIQIVRDGKDFTYQHPDPKAKKVRGATLGADYSKEAIINLSSRVILHLHSAPVTG